VCQDGETALMFACLNGHTETAVALAELGADKNIQNKVMLSPLTAHTLPYIPL
jgi:ankyrin repeat protein